MKKIFSFITACTLLAVMPCILKAQDAIVKKAAAGLSSWVNSNPQEKVYLHLDKPYYAIGDDIWFKAYVVAGPDHVISGVSGVLNVELLNGQDSVFKFLKLNVLHGTAKGDFYLTDTLDAGNYRIRAYTNWMRNAGPAYYFDRTIKVGSAINKAAIIKSKPVRSRVKTNTNQNTALVKKTDVQFFPESGSLVNGLWTKVAFKAVGPDGLGKEVTGMVIDNTNQEVATITTQHLGMGVFTMMPEAGKTYTAQVKFPDGSQAGFALPKAMDSGYIMSVSNANPDYIAVRLAASAMLINKPVHLVAQSCGDVEYAADVTVQNNIVVTRLPKAKFPSGILQITLFDSNGQPTNERVVFIDNPDKLKLDVTPAQQTFGAQKKVSFNIGANSPDDKPVISTLSASVIDETRVPADAADEVTILSSILLSSDVRGYIEKPGYYFSNKNEKTDADLDLLMLTQAYRRFTWHDLLNGSVPTTAAFRPQKALEITGSIKTLTGKTMPGAKVSLYSRGDGVLALDTVADANGRFVFDNMAFNDSTRFVVQGRNNKDKKYVQVLIDTAIAQRQVANPNFPDVTLNNQIEIDRYLENSKKLYDADVNSGIGRHATLLNEVKIKATQIVKLSHISNLNGKGHADQVIKADVLATGGCSNLYICLQGKVAGVIFRGGQLFIPGSVSFQSASMVPMAVIIDGIFVDGTDLGFIDPQDVESVEVLRSTAYLTLYGSQGAQGVLVINLKTGLDGSKGTAYNPWRLSIRPKGYYIARTFYSPQYDDPKTNTALADLRSTIYWNPEIITNKDGKAAIDYFNAGSPGNYSIVIEGIDGEGHIGHKVFKYSVQ